MPSWLYFIADYFPWWAIPICLICLEIANMHRRLGDRKMMVKYLVICGFFMVLIATYFFFNGFENMRPGMENMERKIRTK